MKLLNKHNMLIYAKTEKDEQVFLGLFAIYKSVIKKSQHRKFVKKLSRHIIKARYYKTYIQKGSLGSLYLTRFNKMKSCPILDGLYPERYKKWRQPNRRYLAGKELSFANFSFIDNPIETLNYFRWLAEAECVYPPNSCKLNFVDESINDISSYLLFGSTKPNMFPFFSGGIMSHNIKKIMKPLKLDEYLDIVINKNEQDNDNTIFALPVYSRKGSTERSSDIYKIESRDVVTTKVCEQFDTWLQKLSEGTDRIIKLSPFGKQSLSGIIGEILDNAERHANISTKDDDGIWHITCFMKYDESENKYTCCLSVFNKGDSIAKSIQSALDMKVSMKLKHYINTNKNVDKDLLATVFALQDNSTRTKDESHGGWGFMSMVDFIRKISSDKPGEEPNITIISGDSYIRFAKPYIMMDMPSNMPRYQWFNPANSQDIPPDKNFVFKLQNKISGTIITTRFYLNKDALTHE